MEGLYITSGYSGQKHVAASYTGELIAEYLVSGYLYRHMDPFLTYKLKGREGSK